MVNSINFVSDVVFAVIVERTFGDSFVDNPSELFGSIDRIFNESSTIGIVESSSDEEDEIEVSDEIDGVEIVINFDERGDINHTLIVFVGTLNEGSL